VRVRARTLLDEVGPSPDALAAGAAPRSRVELIRDGKVAQSADLVPIGRPDAGRLEATVGPLRQGDYELRVADGSPAPATRPAGDLLLPLHVGNSYEAELADVSPDHAVLRRLADASGGEFFTLDQVNRLSDRLALAAERRPRFVEQRLWDSPYLFAFVVGCLAAEWAARKRIGLA
jgi:hypothetical protein